MNVVPYGESALLVETDDGQSPVALAARLTGRAGIGEVVPGARTLLVETAPPGLTGEDLLAMLTGSTDADEPPAGAAEIAVRYDGPDLDEVAQLAGMSAADVVRLHSGGSYRVAFCGFAPGFAYLTGLDPALHVPRRDAPRTAVPAGSVAVAGEFTAVYPRRSPGGWRLIGSTDVALWDVDRSPPALLVPGTAVRFVAQ